MVCWPGAGWLGENEMVELNEEFQGFAGWLGENEMVELNEEFQGLMDEMDESGLSWGIWAVGGFWKKKDLK